MISLRMLKNTITDFQFLKYIENEHEDAGNASPYSDEALTIFLQGHQDLYLDKQLRLLIEEVNTPVGFIDLYNFDTHTQKASIGIIIAKQYRHKEYAKQAIINLVDYAFKTLHLQALEASIPKQHVGSRKLFERCGFATTNKGADIVTYHITHAMLG